MSQSVQSSKAQFEETSQMMEETPSTRKNPEYTLSEDEEENSDERVNNYQYDEFVVPDNYNDETDEMAGTDTESKKRQRRRKRKKKDFSLDKEDTDLLEQNLGSSTDGYKRLRKARRSDTEDDDLLEDDGELSSSYQRDKKMQSYDDLRLINQIFHNDTEGEDGDKFMDEDGDMEDERANDLKGYFEPEEIQSRYQTEDDRAIIEKDEPERLQIRFGSRPIPDNQELIEETNWLVEKIMVKNGITSKDTVNLKSKVHKVLEYLRLAGCEIMYIWTHKKHDVTSDRRNEFDKNEYELKLSDLWYIYDLDLEWMHIYKMRRNIHNLMEKLETFSQTSKNVKNSFRSCYDLGLLKYYLDYVVYQLKKYNDDQQIYKMMADDPKDYSSTGTKRKKMNKRNYAKAVMKLNLHEVGNQIFITPDQMAENLIVADQRFRPKIINDSPDKIANEYSNPSYPLISEPVETLTTLCEFTALELFHHPIIRKNLKRLYFDKVLVFTDPTPKGEKEISVYDFYYPVKRIRGKKPSTFVGDLWMIALEAQKKGLIKINFRLPWGDDEKKDEIRNRLMDLYLLEIKARGAGDELDTIKAWNVVREEAISKLLKKFAYPSFERTLSEELREVAEKNIIYQCAKSFKDTINMKPYKKYADDGETEEDKSRIKVLSCVSEGLSGVCHFVLVDENGELRDHLKLNHIGRHPGNDFTKRNIYNDERNELKKFMFRNYPDVMVTGTTNLGCQQIKMELNNIASEVLEEIKTNFTNNNYSKPFGMWGFNTVPKAFSNSYRAVKQYGELDSQVREALSLARMVQDPLAETLALWSDRSKDNVILNFSYHTMQHMVNKAKLKNEFEKIAMEVCNNVGVDINRCIKHRHLSAPLQFISGLGPRKASSLLERIGHELGHLRMRRELFENFLEKTVYINCIGFIRINPLSDLMEEELVSGVYDALDTTRIHPDFYQMAVKIAKEALDDPGNDKVDAARRVMENPKKLEELDLNDYAEHLRQRGKTNMMILIQFIVQELTRPFEDPRSEYKTKLGRQELFYKLTKESKYALREESIVTVRITRIDQKAVRVVTDSGIPGIIMISDLKDKISEIKEGEIGKYYDVREYLRAKVRQINYDLFRLRLSTKVEDLINHRDFIKKNKLLERYDLNENYNFAIEKDKDFPSITQDKMKRTSRYIPRRINHPKFKNISLSAAVDYLMEREIGDFVIRPSSKGVENLNITWKLSSDNIVHLDIKEGHKGANDQISKHLKLDREVYESLDEIIERYIKSCNNLVSQIREHKKFMDEPLSYVKETLVEEKKNDPTLIPYYISFTPEVSQYLILSYIPKHFDIKSEYIKIKPEALLFHDRKFTSIKILIAWFKSKLKTSEYQKYLENTPTLYELSNRKIGGAEEEFKRKSRKNRRRDENEGRRRNRKSKKEEEWEGGLKEVKNENVSRSRSRSQDKDKRREKREEGSKTASKIGSRKGKKSAVSKYSRTSEFLHNAWGTNNNQGETWEDIKDDKEEWGAKSEIKTETDWGLKSKADTKNEGWENWNEEKSMKTNNDATSNW